jgi:prepilin-type processing-associated H-X9-DG protein
MNCTNGENVVPGGYPHPFYDVDGTGEVYAFHAGGVNVVFGDGSVRFLDEDIAIGTLTALITRNQAGKEAPLNQGAY